MAHVLQRVHGEAAASAAARRRGLRPDVGRRRAASSAPRGDRPARARSPRRSSSSSICAPCARPYAVDDVDMWELLVSRGRAAHVDSVVVGRPRADARAQLLHLDRDAIMAEVADAAAAAIARRNPRRARVDRAARAPHRRALPGAGLARGRLIHGFHPSPIGSTRIGNSSSILRPDALASRRGFHRLDARAAPDRRVRGRVGARALQRPRLQRAAHDDARADAHAVPHRARGQRARSRRDWCSSSCSA